MAAGPPPCSVMWVPSRSAATVEAQRLARLYAPARVPVVIVGATGTGKSHLARWIHAWSGRPDGLTDVTVGEFDPNLARDQLFGHVRGGFTGAVERRSGLLTEAEGGTLLLDDFHNLGLETQAMLLRVLDTGWYQPIGFDRNLPLRCRLLLGMREDPDSLLASGRLLPDLRYRLGRAEIRLPRLEERREDIVPLAEHFLHHCPEDTGVEGPRAFAPDVPAVLEAASWPGNLRDLRSTVQIAYMNAQETSEITFEHLPTGLRKPLRFEPRGDPDWNRRVVEWALWRARGHVGKAAALVGAHRNTVSGILATLDGRLFTRRHRGMHNPEVGIVQREEIATPAGRAEQDQVVAPQTNAMGV